MRARLLVQHDDRRAAGDLRQDARDRPRVLAVGGDDQAAGVAVPARAQLGSLSLALRRIRGSPSGSSVEIAVRKRRPRSREATTSSNEDSITSSPDCHWSVPS